MFHRSALLTLALSGLAASAAAAPDPASGSRIELSVLTYNVWGLPVITPELDARIAAIGPAIAELSPDVVVLQEVWFEEDREVLTRAFESAGLSHTLSFDTFLERDSGLLFASVHPIVDAEFVPFTQGQHPHQPLHLDWIAGKGVGVVTLRTPVGLVRLAGTHMQSTYGTGDYLFVQLSQVLETARALDAPELPLVLAGDFNTRFGELPFHLLTARLGLSLTEPRPDIDTVLIRDGNHVDVETVKVDRVLTEPVFVSDRAMPLSDHPGVLAHLALSRQGHTPVLGASEEYRTLALTALPSVRTEIIVREARLARNFWLGLVLALVGGWALLWLPPWRPRLGRGVVVGLMLSASWFTYLSVSYEPAHLEGLELIKTELERETERAPRSVAFVQTMDTVPERSHTGLP